MPTRLTVQSPSALFIPIIAYHGTPYRFEAFDLACVGQGRDQEGPGFYVTSDPADAAVYASRRSDTTDNHEGVILIVELALERPVPIDRPATRREVETLIRRSPVLADRLAAWDECPTRALRMAVGVRAGHATAHEAFLAVYADSYSDHPRAHLEAMDDLG